MQLDEKTEMIDTKTIELGRVELRYHKLQNDLAETNEKVAKLEAFIEDTNASTTLLKMELERKRMELREFQLEIRRMSHTKDVSVVGNSWRFELLVCFIMFLSR